MIYDSISNLERYSNLISPETAAFLARANELTANGRYELAGGCFVLVQRYATKNPWEAWPEAHRRYIDLQYIIDGSEVIEVSPVTGLNEKIAYNEEKDIAFYENASPANSVSLIMKRGNFAVFYPEDAHKPCLVYQDTDNVLKAVVKIPVEQSRKQELAAKLATVKTTMEK